MATFTAQDAAHALAEVPDFEERLSTRVLGVTLMVWGLAATGIFLAYGVLDFMDVHWAAYELLWIPFVLAGMATTHYLWRAHHQALRVEGDKHRWWPSFAVLAGTAGAFLLITEVWLDLDWGVALAMLFANGVLLAGFGLFCQGAVRTTHFAFGAFMEIEAIVIGVLDLGLGEQVLATAGAALIGWVGAGLLLARRG